MEPFTAWVAKRASQWWLANRPFSPEKRAFRKERRRVKRENRDRAERGEELLPLPQKPEVADMFEFISSLRTSTKGGAVGAAAPFLSLLAFLPFHDQINAVMLAACQSEQGPLIFLVGAGVTWVSFYITARRSKTPANPGVL